MIYRVEDPRIWCLKKREKKPMDRSKIHRGRGGWDQVEEVAMGRRYMDDHQ